VISNDTGLSDDPYEQFLSSGRRFSQEKGWLGLDTEADENAPATLCYTSVCFIPWKYLASNPQIGLELREG